MEYNGGCVLAMVGKECVAIGSDLRFGVQAQTMATDKEKIYKVNEKAFVGLAGLATDNQTLVDRLRYRHKLYQLREERDMKPSVLANLVSTLLYEKRFGPYFVEPVICGLEGPNNKPYICAMDLIGAQEKAEDFAVCGDSSKDALFGLCESLWRPNMEPEDLFETTAQCLLSAVDRDAVSGWGAVIHVITKDKVITRYLRGRQD